MNQVKKLYLQSRLGLIAGAFLVLYSPLLLGLTAQNYQGFKVTYDRSMGELMPAIGRFNPTGPLEEAQRQFDEAVARLRETRESLQTITLNFEKDKQFSKLRTDIKTLTGIDARYIDAQQKTLRELEDELYRKARELIVRGKVGVPEAELVALRARPEITDAELVRLRARPDVPEDAAGIDALKQKAAHVDELLAEVEQLKGLAADPAELDRLRARVAQLEQELRQRPSLDDAAELGRLRAEVENLKRRPDIPENADQIAELRRKAAQVDELTAKNAQLEEQVKRIAELEAEIARLKAELEAKPPVSAGETERLKAEITKLTDDNQRISKELIAARAAQATAQRELDELRTAKLAEIKTLQEYVKQLGAAIAELEKGE